MIIKKLQIPARVPGIVPKRLFDLSCPFDSNWVTVKKHNLCYARASYWFTFFLCAFLYGLFSSLTRFWEHFSRLCSVFRSVNAPSRSIANLKHCYNEHQTEKQQSPSFSCEEKRKPTPKNDHAQRPTWEPYRHNSTRRDVTKQKPKTETRRSKNSYDQNISHNGGPFLLGIDKERFVTLHVVLCAPIRKVAARMRENVSLLHRPTRSSLLPFVPGKCFVLVGDSSVDVLPNLVDTPQIVTSLYQVTFRVLCQAHFDLVVRAKHQSFVGFVSWHDLRPLLIKLCTCLKLSPHRHCVLPIQVITLLRVNLRTRWCTSKKDH